MIDTWKKFYLAFQLSKSDRPGFTHDIILVKEILRKYKLKSYFYYFFIYYIKNINIYK